MPNNQDLKSLSLPLKFLSVTILTALYGILLLDSYWGFGFTLINFTFVGLLFFLRPDIRNKESLFYLGLSLALSLFIPFRDFDTGRALTFFSVFILNCLAVSRANSPESQTLSLKSLISIPIQVVFLSFSQILYWLEVARSLFTGQRKITEFSKSNLVMGIVLAIPILIVFTILLSSADPLFQRYTSEFFSKINIDIMVVKKILEMSIFFGLFSALLSNTYKIHQEFLLLVNNHTVQKEIAVATTLTSILLGGFLIVQGQFLFAQERLLKELNIMYSEYTRRGYTELLIISAISLSMISILTNKGGQKASNFIKGITLVFIAEVFLLLVSATYRVYLYQDIHGFTQIRLLGIMFSIWLTITLFIFLYRHFQDKEIPLFTYLFSNAMLVILLMQFINIDHTIAVIKKPNLGYGTDYPYILNLSTDAQPGWEEALVYLEKDGTDCTWDSTNALWGASLRTLSLKTQAESNWHNSGSWTLPDSQALAYLEKNNERIKKLYEKHQNCYAEKSASQYGQI